MEGLGAMSPAERYAAAADNFTRLVGGVSDWDGPSPVKEWTAREVVGHLVTWVPGMIGGAQACGKWKRNVTSLCEAVLKMTSAAFGKVCSPTTNWP